MTLITLQYYKTGESEPFIFLQRRNKLHADMNTRSYLFVFVILARESVGKSLQGRIGKSCQRRHGCNQDHILGQADDESRDGEAHHTAQVDRS